MVWSILKGNQNAGNALSTGVLARFSIVLFIFCALTDFIDGYLARKWKVTSDFGRMLDPIADKLLVAACLIGFCIISLGDWRFIIPALLIIGRDITISGVREYAALAGKVMAPTKLAKWKTATEMAGITAVLVWIAAFKRDIMLVDGTADTPSLLLAIAIALLWLAAFLSVFTGFKYFRSALAKV